jgi:hypothetical protein
MQKENPKTDNTGYPSTAEVLLALNMAYKVVVEDF